MVLDKQTQEQNDTLKLKAVRGKVLGGVVVVRRIMSQDWLRLWSFGCLHFRLRRLFHFLFGRSGQFLSRRV